MLPIDKKTITNHADLVSLIDQLKSESKLQENLLKEKFKALSESLNPVNLVKKSLTDLASDKSVRLNVGKLGLNFGANMIIDKIFGKYRSLGGFFRSTIVESICTGVINKKYPKIAAIVQQFMAGR
jgi:hypothetical protein